MTHITVRRWGLKSFFLLGVCLQLARHAGSAHRPPLLPPPRAGSPPRESQCRPLLTMRSLPPAGGLRGPQADRHRARPGGVAGVCCGAVRLWPGDRGQRLLAAVRAGRRRCAGSLGACVGLPCCSSEQSAAGRNAGRCVCAPRPPSPRPRPAAPLLLPLPPPADGAVHDSVKLHNSRARQRGCAYADAAEAGLAAAAAAAGQAEACRLFPGRCPPPGAAAQA